LHSLVQDVAEEWIKAASSGIHLVFGDFPDAEIRVSFATPYLWSYVGTDALFVPRDKPTICLGAIASTSDYSTKHSAAMHELGHTLGLIHPPQLVTASSHTGEPARLNSEFDRYFAEALNGHFHDLHSPSNVLEQVKRQAKRTSSDERHWIPGGAIMADPVATRYTNDRQGNEEYVIRPWIMPSIHWKEVELVHCLYSDHRSHISQENRYGLLTSEPGHPPTGEHG
jgi:hypothetical protein